MACRYSSIMKTYAKVRKVFSSTSNISVSLLNETEESITFFTQLVRSEICVRQGRTITPKLHLLEDQAVPCLQHFNIGLGRLGEQGGESLHHQFKDLERRFGSIKTAKEQLKIITKQHPTLTNISHHQLIPQPATWRRKSRDATAESTST